eukprot:CAMPEP_0197679986 /NCGR_PEP_ID=MMETSP1338-20131121/92546_1 /TAXON_ID=43686 ORGANISM="Pelagodinium beii, Strain RCC1491" /NCGR_SAMPLE_ID=MMETSP1338 /ASSEMBLY_ACC=CAM_ASM_000754 /LENGTH=38 /DNA_ID= /DNA_START= /DNA_END= /DNA_ORIENTATION=
MANGLSPDFMRLRRPDGPVEPNLMPSTSASTRKAGAKL